MNKIHLLMITLFICNYLNAQDWNWLNPLPGGNNLNCVKFADSNIGYSVGNQGTILKTTNGGINWEVQMSGTNNDLFSISVIDKDTVYICGLHLKIFKTTNGGNTWIQNFNQQYTSYYMNFIFFVNPAVGYAAGDAGLFYKTTNYGKDWVDIGFSNFQNGSSIFFTSVDTGYATMRGSQGIILKTTNGGTTWSNISVPIIVDYYSIVFTDKYTGYLIGYSGTILKTMDEGNNWIIQNQYSTNLTSSPLYSVYFVNQDEGYIVGRTAMLKTTNAGNNWVLMPQSEYNLSSVYFTDVNQGCAVGGVTINEEAGIIRTTDGGNNWNNISNTVTQKSLRSVKFINSNIGYAVGGNANTFSGTVLKTTNAGNTWLNLNTGINTYFINSLCTPDSNTIYITGENGQILKSTNAGMSWIALNTMTNNSLYSICFPDSNIGYAVGNNGTIIKTTNGGSNWSILTSGTTSSLLSVFFKDNDSGFISAFDWTADSTMILSTSNGGLNWSKKYIGGALNPRKIFFLNNDTGFIAAGFGAIYKTTDGGNHWNVTYHNGNDYWDISFIDNNTGYVIGNDGEISKTENCGLNWVLLNSGTTKDLFSIFSTDLNTAYAVGNNGAILKTTTSGCGLTILNPNYYSICNGDSIVIRPNTIGGVNPLSFQWSNSMQSQAIIVSPSTNTNYQVTVTDSEFESIVLSITVHVTPLPVTPVIQLHADTLISNVLYGNQWYRNDTLIINANYYKYVAILPGYYYSIVTSNNCSSEKSNIIPFSVVVNVNEFSEKNGFTLYPSPSTSTITLEISEVANECNLLIFNANGEILNMQSISNTKTQIDLSNFKNGLYFMQLITGNNIIIKKVLKE